MRATRVLRAARASRLVDTGYIKSAFIPVAQKVQLAYSGRDPDVQRVLGDAEQRFEQSLSLQVLAAPMERDIVSGLTLPRSLSLPLSWMSISRRLEAPAAIAAAKAIAEEEARAEAEAASKVAARAARDTNTGPRDVVYDADAPNLRGDDDERVGAQGWKENKKARKARAANRAASMALQGPSMPWTAPAPIIKPRAKRKEVLENGERRWLTDPLETRRLRLNRARRTVLQMASAARKARAWTVWYDVVVVPQLSFAAAAPREEAHAWPQAQHTDIYFPHTKREWIFIHPTFVRSIFDTKTSFTTAILVPNVAPGQDVSDRDAPKPGMEPLGLRFAQLERWTRGTPLGTTRPLAGEDDPWMDRPLRLPVTDSAEVAPESAIRERITCYAPVNLVELCHAALQAEVLVSAGWSPEHAFALFPALRSRDMDVKLGRSEEPEIQIEGAGKQHGKDQESQSPRDDVPGADPAAALKAGLSSTQIAEIRDLLSTTALLGQAGGLAPGQGFTPAALAAIDERASLLLALRARHARGQSTAPDTTPKDQRDPILLRQVPQAKAVAVHLWRLMLWRHQPFHGIDSLLNY